MVKIDSTLEAELQKVSSVSLSSEKKLVDKFLKQLSDLEILEEQISHETRDLVGKAKQSSNGVVEEFLQKFNLRTSEGRAILLLAESLLRVEDQESRNVLVLDKLASNSFENLTRGEGSIKLTFSSLGVYFAGKFASLGISSKKPVKLIYRLGKPGFIYCVRYALELLCRQFTLGASIDEAINNTEKLSEKGYNFNFALLKKVASSYKEGEENFANYSRAIEKIAAKFPDKFNDPASNRPSISLKLSRLHPRLEYRKQNELEEELAPKLTSLVRQANNHNITITFEAETSSIQDIYLKLITKVITHSELKEDDRVGVEVQAYQKRSKAIIDYLASLGKKTQRQIIVRLVKGDYWEHEIKRAQELGLKDYPVFLRSEFTDLSYLACAKKIMANTKYLKPQFATHNPQTIVALKKLIKNNSSYEFQKLYGCGDKLYSKFYRPSKTRIYAPVAAPEEASGYLARRIIENTKSSSFAGLVNNPSKNGEEMVYSLLSRCETLRDKEPNIMRPTELYMSRQNSTGIDSGIRESLETLEEEIKAFYDKQYNVSPIIKGKEHFQAKNAKELFRPAKKSEKIGAETPATSDDMLRALDYCNSNFQSWNERGVQSRANILRSIARSFEENQAELLSILIKETGKSINDAIDEIREAVDFCRYYSNKAVELMSEKTLPGPTGEKNLFNMTGRGTFVCISPWNFPLAVFTGQIVAALVAGNCVLAKPAEEATITASKAVKLMHHAGVPKEVLHMLNAPGSLISKYLISNEKASGVAFTGSHATAKIINSAINDRTGSIIPFIAETGGQNAMIIDDTADLTQTVNDVILSSFYSAGQRCSSLRVLYVQDSIYQEVIEKLKGAMECLKVGDTKEFSNDIGPIISEDSAKHLQAHIEEFKNKGAKIHNAIHDSNKNTEGYFIHPHIIEIDSIRELTQEVFGPILHIIPYSLNKLDNIINDINNYGHSLTFGVQSRVDSRVSYIREKVRASNIYVNRSIIFSRVESQPFGGEGFSGTGFKSGGPNYLLKFVSEKATSIDLAASGGDIDLINQNS